METKTRKREERKGNTREEEKEVKRKKKVLMKLNIYRKKIRERKEIRRDN